MEETKDLYAVILAGGSGTCFWPKSRRKTPNNFVLLVTMKNPC